MDEALHVTLARWGNFYLITGTAAAALTGLQFVVQTLLATDELRPVNAGDPEGGIAAFGSPTVVHFAIALIISAVLCMPWPGSGSLRATLGVIGVGAVVYSVIVLRRALRQRSYAPVAEDWLWHVILPGGSYAAVLFAAIFFGDGADGPLFGLATATLLLLCVAIHNAWDTVTYLTVSAIRRAGRDAPHEAPRRGASDAKGRRRR